MQSENGSQWDIMMDIIIDSGKYLVDKQAYEYRSESQTIDFLNRTAELRWDIIDFMNK